MCEISKAIDRVRSTIGWGAIWLFFIMLNTCGSFDDVEVNGDSNTVFQTVDKACGNLNGSLGFNGEEQ